MKKDTAEHKMSRWQKHRLKDLETYRERKREYAKTPEQRKKRNEYMQKWKAKNKEKVLLFARNNYQKHKHKHVERNLNSHLLYKYGITLLEKNAMISEQNNCCKICGKPFKSSKVTHLDHCHKTNKVRGVLCTRCNTALSWFEVCGEAAAAYLK